MRVYSYTQPRENIVAYGPWVLESPEGERRTMTVVEGKAHGKGVVARLEGVADRDAAAALVGWEIKVSRTSLPDAPAGHYYWDDLIGLNAFDAQGRSVGRVTGLMETGAHDVLVIQGGDRVLLPFVVGQTIMEVDLAGSRIVVDLESAQTAE